MSSLRCFLHLTPKITLRTAAGILSGPGQTNKPTENPKCARSAQREPRRARGGLLWGYGSDRGSLLRLTIVGLMFFPCKGTIGQPGGGSRSACRTF